jgi:hypothetical protein
MKSTQAWGWLTAGVLALGLNGFYQDGGAAWAHRAIDTVVARVADRSGALADLASGQVDRFMVKANLVAARNETASCRLATAMARVQTSIARTQTGMAHFEAMSARQEAVLAQLEANRARLEEQEEQVVRVHMAPVVFNMPKIPAVACPRVWVNVPRVNVPMVKIPMVKIPAVHVETLGSEPI